MAHVKILDNPTTFVQMLYMVDAAVGRGSPNRRDDVFVVQFLLNALSGKSPDKSQRLAARVGACG
jgi:hypothetical protein